MAVKMTGAQFKAWMASDWGEDAMWEEEHYTVDDAEVLSEDSDFDTDTISDSSMVVLHAGTIYTDQSDILRSPTVSAVTHARKWLKAQTTVTLMVEVPKDCADQFAGMIAQLGISPGGKPKVIGRLR